MFDKSSKYRKFQMENDCKCKQRDQSKEIRETIEFKDGIPQSYIKLKSNSIRTAKYTIMNFAPLLLYSFGARIGNIYLIACMIFAGSFPKIAPYSTSLYLFSFVISLLLHVCKEIYTDRKFAQQDNKANSFDTRVCREDMETVTWGELCVGDVVYLRQGDTVPADIVLLDSQQLKHRSAITYVNSQEITGCHKILQKKAAYLTQLQYRGIQKNNWSHYRQILSGKLTYQLANKDDNKFHAYLKLVRDPKVEQLTVQNLIPRGSTIKTSLWIFGLVVYAGEDTKIMMRRSQSNKNKRKNLFFILSNQIVIWNICLNFVLSLLFVLVHLDNTNQVDLAIKFLYEFLLFSVLSGSIIYPFLDIISLIVSRKVEKKLNVKVSNPEALQELGCLDYVIMNKTGVIATGDYVINEIMTPSCMYKVYDLTSQRKPRNSKRIGYRNGGSLRSNLMSLALTEKPLAVPSQASCTESQKFEIDDNHFPPQDIPQDNSQSNPPNPVSQPTNQANSHHDYQFQPLVLDRVKMMKNILYKQKQAMDTTLAMALCHQAKFHYNYKKEEFKGISHDPVEELLLRFCKTVGISYECYNDLEKENLINIINDEGEKMQFQVIGTQQFQFERARFSVVYRSGKQANIICKGSPQSMLKIISFKNDEKAKIQAKLAQYKVEGVQPIIYAKKMLSTAEMAAYQSEYMSVKLSLTTTKKQIQEFTNKYENNLEFVCMIGINDELGPCYKDFVCHLAKCKIKYGILTADTAQTTLNVGKKLIACSFTEKIDYINLDFGTKEEIKYQISQTLTLIKNKKNFHFVIVMNQNTAQMVLHDNDSLQHFMYLIYKAKSFVGYGLKPQTIGNLVTVIKNSTATNTTIMAIGYGYHNLQMLSEADVSIGFGDLPADINAQQLNQVIQLIKSGPQNFDQSLCIVNEILYRFGVIRSILTLYEAITYDYMNRIIDSETMWMVINVFTVVGVLIKLVSGFVEERPLSKEQSYPTKTIIKKNIFRQYLLSAFIESALHGLVIVLTTYFILPKCIYYSRYLYDNATENLVLLIQVVFVSMCRFLMFRYRLFKWYHYLLVLITNFATYFICVSIGTFSAGKNLSAIFYKVVLSYDSITMVINCLLFNVAITFFMHMVVKKKFFKYLHIDPSQQYKLLQKFSLEEDRRMVKQLFTSVQNIDPSILEIMNDSDIDFNSIKFDNLMQFKNEPLNHKFRFSQQQANSSLVQRLCWLSIACTIAQIICNLADNHWSPTNPYIIYYLTAFCFVAVLKLSRLISTKYSYLLFAIFVSLCCSGIIAQHHSNDLSNFVLWLCILSIISSELLELRFIKMLILVILFIVTISVIVALGKEQLVTSTLLVLISMMLFCLNFTQYRSEMIDKKSKFLNEQTFKNQNDHAQDILSLLVPKFVHKYIKDGEYKLQQAQNDVSILFCYVCNFDTIVKEQGKNVVHLMDELFRQFDQLCHNYAVQKIQTVGMTYMAATGITAWEEEFDNSYSRKNTVERLLRMSVAMMEKSKGIMYGKNKDKKLTIKIGIHTGKVVIGVIGYHKPQFSLIGDTVNTTSRHCSTAKQGQIILSAQALKKLKYKVTFFDKHQAQMKGLGVVDVYKWNTSEIKVGKDYEEKNKRFRAIVRKVIEQLKRENKIVYKTITQRLKNIFESRSYKQKKSQKMTSMVSLYEKGGEIVGEDQIKEDQHHELTTPAVPQIDEQLLTQYTLKKYNRIDNLYLVSYCIVLLVETMYEIWLLGLVALQIALRAIGLIGLIISIYKYKGGFGRFWVKLALLLIQIYILLIINAQVLYINHPAFRLLLLLRIVFFTLAGALHLFNLKQLIVVFLIGYAIPLSLTFGFTKAIAISSDLSCCIFYGAFVLLRKHRNINLTIEMYISVQIQDKKKRQQEALVSQLLPKHAFLKLRNQNLSNKIELNDQIQGATLLFADIKGFTSYSNKNTPEQVVNMLRKLFQEFDKTCLKFNVYKVYTIGDCYVVLGFTNPFQRDIVQEAKNVVNMGLAMVDIVHNVRQQIDFHQLDMRIGIHTGTIIGGIIGTDIVRYDIYGRDVMIANKFEEYGRTGAVHISAATKAILDTNRSTNFKIVPNGTVRVDKLNVEIPGYIVSRKKFE